MNITDRIVQFLDYKGITKYEFHKKNNFSNGFLDKSRAIGSDKCAIILENYPEISPEWLITGKGEMLKKDIVISNNDNRGGAIVGGNNSGSISINERKEDIALLYERLEHKDREIALLERELKSYKYTEEKLEKANAFTNTLYERKIEDLKQRIEDKDKMLEFLEKMNKLK